MAKSLAKYPLGRSERRYEGNIKMGLMQIGYVYETYMEVFPGTCRIADFIPSGFQLSCS